MGGGTEIPRPAAKTIAGGSGDAGTSGMEMVVVMIMRVMVTKEQLDACSNFLLALIFADSLAGVQSSADDRRRREDVGRLELGAVNKRFAISSSLTHSLTHSLTLSLSSCSPAFLLVAASDLVHSLQTFTRRRNYPART
eukprot:750123-Hanusia_phi.AAC.1